MKRTITFFLSVLLMLSVLMAAIPSAAAQEETVDELFYAETESGVKYFYGDRTPYQGKDEAPRRFDKDISPTGADKDIDIEKYSYQIIPLLSPLNLFFFVKTDNPDPRSFRFADQNTIYSETGDSISAYQDYNDNIIAFADVDYDDPQTGRVNGGYIFKADNYDTDGGSLVLQRKVKSGNWSYTWEDTKVNVTLPLLRDTVDYLIDRFADKGAGFFDNMNAVQDGFESISFYNGSNVRGELVQSDPYWSAAVAGHIDQSFYIYSPYSRKDTRSLFASALYPLRYDSLGFPGMMAAIAQRLDSSSSYEWNKNYHWLVDVTYNGETRSFGGQGKVEGQAISEDKIIRRFTFDENDLDITPEESYDLLYAYSQTEMDDDIPREDALTWEFICDTVGEGAWVKLVNGYTYLYTRENSDSISAEDWGVGNSIYWGGKMGYFTETWVDGRYITNWRRIEQGAKFEDHPNASVYVKNIKVPLVSYKTTYQFDYDTQKYIPKRTVNEITEVEKNVLFEHNSTEDIWTAGYSTFGYQYASYSMMKSLVEEGLLDEKYLDMVTLTREDVEAMNVDKNSDYLPWQGYLFDGTAVPGTPFGFDYLIGDSDGNSEIEVIDSTLLQRYLAEMKTTCSDEELIRGDADLNGLIELPDVTMLQFYLAGMKTNCRIGEIVTDSD